MNKHVSLSFIAVVGLAMQLAGSSAHGQIKPILHLPETPYRYGDVPLPAFYNSPPIQQLDNTPVNNSITDAGATLGRVLFYDTRLSANNTVSCASCHQQQHAFSDAVRFSTGFAGQKTDRNSMALVDLRYYARGRFFWDERAPTLEQQVLMPVQNSHEMGQTLGNLVKVIGSDTHYPALFEKAFGDSQVSAERISGALAQFVRSLVSYGSKYDKGLAATESVATDFPNFTASENRGKQLFLNRCAVCHLPGNQGVIFSTQEPENNGIDANAKVPDLGVADVTMNRFQAGLFKSSSLRNIEYTAPYMHDGRFATLEEVVEHYNSGVKQHPNLDPRLGGRGGRGIGPPQKAELVSFLKTLSDPEFIRDPRFSDPFERKDQPGNARSQNQQASVSNTVRGANP